MAEPGDNAEAAENHEPNCKGVSDLPVEFGHVFEIHAVDSGDKGGGHEHGGDDGERAHHLVEPVTRDAELDIDETGEEVAAEVEVFGDAEAVVVKVLVFG